MSHDWQISMHGFICNKCAYYCTGSIEPSADCAVFYLTPEPNKELRVINCTCEELVAVKIMTE